MPYLLTAFAAQCYRHLLLQCSQGRGERSVLHMSLEKEYREGDLPPEIVRQRHRDRYSVSMRLPSGFPPFSRGTR
jgi:hypothetical protein